jgi:cytochrome b pre-mRNA-processing protein 3
VIGFRKLWNRQGVSARSCARALYADLAAAALMPALYEQGAAQDTFEGRAAMITANATLVMRRLKRIDSPVARKTAEHLNRLVLDGFDSAYRELGVGDSSIARKVRKLAELHYGLGKALMVALNAPPTDRTQSVTDCVRRNAVSEAGRESLLTAYLQHNATRFEAAADEEVLAGKLRWNVPGED